MVFKYSCNIERNVQNYVQEIENEGLWQDISATKNLVAYHADSLIYDVNNNCIESYNSVVAKFVDGKIVNYSLKGNY